MSNGPRNTNCFLQAFAVVLILLGFVPSVAAQGATGAIAGSVKDAQGGVIPGATITLVSETRGTTFTTTTNTTGDFVLPNIPGDVYTVRVTMDGFKATERKGLTLSPGDRLAAGIARHRTGRRGRDRGRLRRSSAPPGGNG